VHDLFGAAKWRLGVDNPIDSADIVQITLKRSRITQRFQRREELQLAGVERLLQGIEK